MAAILKISEGSNLAIHAMAYLAAIGSSQSATAQQIAEQLTVSKDHLGKVLQQLARLGLVESRRGPKGGFSIGRLPEEIMLLEIVEAIDGKLTPSECLFGKPICGGKRCVVGGMVKTVHEQVKQFLEETKLSELPLKAFLRDTGGDDI